MSIMKACWTCFVLCFGTFSLSVPYVLTVTVVAHAVVTHGTRALASLQVSRKRSHLLLHVTRDHEHSRPHKPAGRHFVYNGPWWP